MEMSKPKLHMHYSTRWDEELIIQVSKHPHLFNGNPSTPKHYRIQSWREISNILNVHVPVCKARWKNIRTQYTRLKKLNETQPESSSGKEKKEWPLLHLLGFLEDKDFKPTLSPSLKRTRRLLPRPSPLELPSSVSLVDSSTGTTVVRHLKMENNRTGAQMNMDPDELYLLSLLPAFKRLTERAKAEVRVNIETILYTAEFGVNTGNDDDTGI